MEISLRKVFAKACLEQKYVRKKVEILTYGISYGLELSNGQTICLMFRDALANYEHKLYFQGIMQDITKQGGEELLSMFDKSGANQEKIVEEAMQYLHNEFGSDVVITD